MEIADNKYLLYLIIWLLLVFLMFSTYKFIKSKIKKLHSRDTRNSLFSLMMMINVPLFFVIVLAPTIIIAGDEFMPESYKYIFGVIVFLLICVYFIFRRRISGKSAGRRDIN